MMHAGASEQAVTTGGQTQQAIGHRGQLTNNADHPVIRGRSLPVVGSDVHAGVPTTTRFRRSRERHRLSASDELLESGANVGATDGKLAAIDPTEGGRDSMPACDGVIDRLADAFEPLDVDEMTPDAEQAFIIDTLDGLLGGPEQPRAAIGAQSLIDEPHVSCGR